MQRPQNRDTARKIALTIAVAKYRRLKSVMTVPIVVDGNSIAARR